MTLESMFSLKGKKALVAGASRGIGLAIAKATAGAGANTVLAARSLEALEREAAALRDQGYQADTAPLDITTHESIDSLAAAHGDADILVNVAGTNIRKPFEQYTQDDYNYIMETNLNGIVRLTQKVGGLMIERGQGGKVVHIGSLMSVLGLPYLSVLRDDEERTGRADAGAGGGVGEVRHSGQLHRSGVHPDRPQPAHVATSRNGRVAQGAAAEPAIGDAGGHRRPVGILSSPAANYITGQVIASDGGYTTTANWPFEP